MKRTFIIVLVVVVLLIGVGFAYWYFFFNGPGGAASIPGNQTPQTNGFEPFGTISTSTTSGSVSSGTDSSSNSQNGNTPANQIVQQLPILRTLSSTPVGGFAASSTATSTIVRWVDRGRGNVYEINEAYPTMETLSNTIVPRIYESVWNKNMTAFIAMMLTDQSETPTTVYSELHTQGTTAASSTDQVMTTPYQLKGKDLPDNILAYAVNPAGDKIFLLVNTKGQGIGYVANFDGSKMTQIFSTPITQVNAEWPEANTISLTTKGSSVENGFMYFVNPKTGSWKKILGPLNGLSTKVSHDAKYVFVSSTGSNSDIHTFVYNVKTSDSNDSLIHTLADKCVWGHVDMGSFFCGVPSTSVAATYPDDWYTGAVSFSDKIWQVNAVTGEIHQVASLADKANKVIDTFNLYTDPKDDYLIFMNKNDLSLWSLDLIRSQNN